MRLSGGETGPNGFAMNCVARGAGSIAPIEDKGAQCKQRLSKHSQTARPPSVPVQPKIWEIIELHRITRVPAFTFYSFESICRRMKDERQR